jgi:hypothetical protein
MSAGANRRDLRRRLLHTAPVNSGPLEPPTARGGQRTVAYAPEALPERHPSFATRIPSGRLALWAVSVAAVLVNIVFTLTVLETRPGGSLARWTSAGTVGADAGRFHRSLNTILATLAAPGAMAGPRPEAGLPPLRLPDWLGQSCLFAAAAVALAIRQMRRHRLDDFQGRYRAWGWLASLLFTTAIARQLPLGRFVAALLTDTSGLVLGPDGIGWWLAAAAIGWLAVGAWCLVPLHRRLASTMWLVVGWTAWCCGAAIDCTLRSGHPSPQWMGLAGSLSIALGDTSILLATLWAFRTVLKEVRGETSPPLRQPAADTNRGRRGEARGVEEADSVAATESDSEGQGPGPRDASERSAPDSTGVPRDPYRTAFHHEPDLESDDDSDGAGQGSADRKLSKAERRRLRKQARLDRAA